MSRQIIKLLGVDKSFTEVFNAPTKCDNQVHFKLDNESYLAKGVASVENQLYKFWEHSLAEVFTQTDGFDKPLIIYLHDANKFKSTLGYFDQKFDMIVTADYDLTYNAYVAKKITVQSPTLSIDFACMEAVLGYVEYTQEMLSQKTNISNPGAKFTIGSPLLNRMIRLCNIGTFEGTDTVLNLECTKGELRAFNANFNQLVESGFSTDFRRISIKSKFLSVLDANNNWNISYDTLASGGTKWIFENESKSIIAVIGGLAHDDDNENIDNAGINEKFDKEFENFLEQAD